MSSAREQFALLLWKNFKLQGRKKFVTVFEMVIPLCFALLLLFSGSPNDIEYCKEPLQTSIPVYPHLRPRPPTKTKLFFTPNNSFTNDLMSEVLRSTNATGKIFF